MNDWQQYQALNQQLRREERQQRQQAGAAQNWDSYQFTISPTCPPSTSIFVRGGMTSWIPHTGIHGDVWFVPDYTVDLADTSQTKINTNYPNGYTFTNANWYVPATLGWDLGLSPGTYGLRPTNPIMVIYPTEPYTVTGRHLFVEYQTATEAEAAYMAKAPDDMTWYVMGFMQRAVILRNNGNTAGYNQWMEVDAVNRGRSYLFQDPRPKWIW